MHKTIFAAGFALMLGAGAALAQSSTTSPSTSGSAAGSVKMTSNECQSLWNKADASKAGSLTQSQALPYMTSFSTADTNNDGKISNQEFMAACQSGHVKDSATTGAGTGTSGSSSSGTPGSTGSNGSTAK